MRLSALVYASSLAAARAFSATPHTRAVVRAMSGLDANCETAAVTPLLFCKPASDGICVGDCPFTHYARMALELAGAEYLPMPLKPKNKPDWHVADHGGSMPCLAPRGLYNPAGAVSDSGAIAKGALAPTPADDAALEACGGLFLGIAKFLKNTDDAKDPDLRAGLDAQLDALERALAAADGPFLSGATPGVADCSVATKLYVLLVGAGHYKSFVLDGNKHGRVGAYYASVSALPAFYSTRYPETELLHGWGEARGGGH